MVHVVDPWDEAEILRHLQDEFSAGLEVIPIIEGAAVPGGAIPSRIEDVPGWLATSHSLVCAKLTKKARAQLGLA